MALSLKYGDYTLASSAYIDGPYKLETSLNTGSFSCTIHIVDDAGVKATCEALEAGFRSRNVDFQLLLNGSPIVDWRLSTGTATNTDASAEKIGGEIDSRISRAYQVTVSAKLPADRDGRAGQQDYRIEIERDDYHRVTATVSGVTTALPGAASYTTYQSLIDGWVGTAQTIAGVDVWYKVSESYDTDEVNGVTNFSVSYREHFTNLTVVYNGVQLGGSSTPIDDFDFARTNEEVSISFVFLNTAGVNETKLRTPRKDLKVQIGSITLFDGKQADGTIIDAQPELSRLEIPAGGGPAGQRYQFSVSAKIREDLLGLGGRRNNARVSVETDPVGFRRLRLSGAHTASSGNASAVEAFRAAGWSAAIREALGGVWERVSSSYDRGETDLELTFDEEYRELLNPRQTTLDPEVDDDGNPVNFTGVIEHDLSVSVTRPLLVASPWGSGPWGSGYANMGEIAPFVETRVTASLKVPSGVKEKTEEGDPPDVESIERLKSVLKQTMITEFKASVGNYENYTETEYTVTYNPDTRTLNAELGFESMERDIVEYRRNVRTSKELGVVIQRVWDSSSVYAAREYTGLGRWMIEVEETGLFKSGKKLPSTSTPRLESGLKAVKLSESIDEEDINRGDFALTRFTRRYSLQVYHENSSGY